jgi:copper chaperone CopZ
MKCGGCEKAVEKALGAVDGVEAAKADHATGKVVVTAADSVDHATLADAVRTAGYGVD